MNNEPFTVSEAADFLRVSESFLNKARLSGRGPRFVRVGRNLVRYWRSDLEAWLNQSAEPVPAANAASHVSHGRV